MPTLKTPPAARTRATRNSSRGTSPATRKSSNQKNRNPKNSNEADAATKPANKAAQPAPQPRRKKHDNVPPEHMPPVPLPSLRFHAKFRPQERAVLTELLAEPYEVMEDEQFLADDAEETIFDPQTDIPRPTTSWYAQLAYEPREAPKHLRAAKLPLLKPAEEKVAFLKSRVQQPDTKGIKGLFEVRESPWSGLPAKTAGA